MERVKLIVIPLCPMIRGVPGDAVLLRAALMERDFPNETTETTETTLPRSQTVLLENLTSESSSLSKKAQFNSLPPAVFLMANLPD